MATTTIIPLHAGKGRTVSTALGLTVNYVENPDKTDDGEWVTAYECDPLIADKEFLFSKRQYTAITGRDQGERDVIGYHLRISFKPGETDAATANRIGYDLAMKLTHGNHAFVCCTHVDKAHTHCHMVINSTSLDCTKKFRNFKGSSFVIRKIADHLCLENGLSIIENPKPSRGSYGTWLSDEKPPTLHDKLRDLIDNSLRECKSFEQFLASMKAVDCEVKTGKHLAFKSPEQKKYIRCNSLGEDYTEDAIRERISGKRVVVPKQKPTVVAAPVFVSARPSLLIDIQTKLQQAHSPGFEHFAKLFNLKESAKTLIFLQENNLADYDLLSKKTTAAGKRFNEISGRLKPIETRLGEISNLQKHIGTYGKTRDVYRQYRDGGWSKKFYAEHESDIILHKAAKKFFDESGMKKLPSINTLKQEYAALDVEKKKLYQGYRPAREEMITLQMTKQNVDKILNLTPQTQKPKEKSGQEL